MKLSSMRTRLLLVYQGLAIVGFGTLMIWAGQQISANTYADFGNNLRLSALLLNPQLIEVLEYGRVAQGRSAIAAASRDLEATIAIYDRQGNFLFSSDEAEYPLQVEDGYEYANGRLWASAPVREDGDQLLGTVQILVPDEVPRSIIRSRWLGLGIGFAFVTLVGFAASLWLVNTLTRPLNTLRQTALGMASGDLGQRVPHLATDEANAVGRAFNQMATRVEAMIAEQRAFASNASHELRTPITTIRLRTDAMLDDEGLDSETRTTYVSEIDLEARRMGRLVEDLLLLSRLDAQRAERGEEQIDYGRLLHFQQQKFQLRAQSKNISLMLQVPKRPIFVQVNPNHLQIVVRNLIDNALKYTPAGGQVTVSLQEENHAAKLTVADSGRGIAEADLPQVGQRFFRADKARTRAVEGTGLGLSLVHSIVALYDGSFELQSDGLGEGVTVFMCWPLSEIAV